ncbi:MAG: universal stress protein [Polyangiaceae bacterium]
MRRATALAMRVLVATDLSESSAVALREGAALASSPSDALAAVHVLPPFKTVSAAVLDLSAADVSARAARAVRSQVAKITDRRHDIEVFIDEGYAHVHILQRAEAWHADVVVVGTHGRLGLAHVLGGVAERVARGGRCRVLVARPQSTRGWVLVATNLSQRSLRAVTVAADEARRRGARLKVVQSVGFVELEMIYVLDLESSLTSRTSAAQLLSETIAGLGVTAECDVLERSPAAAIVGEAEEIGAELIVVGARGATSLSPLTELAPGGVTDRVVRHALCSVLIVP